MAPTPIDQYLQFERNDSIKVCHGVTWSSCRIVVVLRTRPISGENISGETSVYGSITSSY